MVALQPGFRRRGHPEQLAAACISTGLIFTDLGAPSVKEALMSMGARSEYRLKDATIDRHHQKYAGWSWWYLLFLIQFIAVLWPPFYNKVDPSLIGIPFFYWYQLLWVILGAILTAIVHFATED